MKTTDINATARTAAIRQLAAAYDVHAMRERDYVARGLYALAQEAHEVAARIMRAYNAEMNDKREGTAR